MSKIRNKMVTICDKGLHFSGRSEFFARIGEKEKTRRKAGLFGGNSGRGQARMSVSRSGSPSRVTFRGALSGKVRRR